MSTPLPVSKRPFFIVWACLGCALSGCAEPDPGAGLDSGDDLAPDVACDGVDDPDQTHMVVLRSLSFGRADAEGRAWGFDLDGLQSDGADPQGCYHADYTSPDGRTGVDSGLTGALPTIDNSNASIIEGLLQQTINDGGLLITLALDDLDDPTADGCTRARVGRAAGAPMLATDGTIESGQTYARDPDFAEIVVPGVAIADGAVEFGPFAWELELVLFEAPLDIGLADARIHYQISTEGVGSGYLGGRMMLYQIPDFLKAIKSDAYDAVDAAMRTSADLSPNGSACAEISAVFTFETVPAYYYE